MRVLITRPAADAERLARPLRERGVTVTSVPMLDVAATDAPLPLSGVAGYVLTSANGARALAARVSAADKARRLWAVGGQTARVARHLGFRDVVSAEGDVETLIALIANTGNPADGVLLHAGATVTRDDVSRRLTKSGFSVRKAALYETRPVAAMPPQAVAALRAGEANGVFFFSPRTSETFRRLARKAELMESLRTTTAWCLSAAVADALADAPFRERLIAAAPTQESLLAAFDAGGGGPATQTRGSG